MSLASFLRNFSSSFLCQNKVKICCLTERDEKTDCCSGKANKADCTPGLSLNYEVCANSRRSFTEHLNTVQNVEEFSETELHDDDDDDCIVIGDDDCVITDDSVTDSQKDIHVLHKSTLESKDSQYHEMTNAVSLRHLSKNTSKPVNSVSVHHSSDAGDGVSLKGNLSNDTMVGTDTTKSFPLRKLQPRIPVPVSSSSMTFMEPACSEKSFPSLQPKPQISFACGLTSALSCNSEVQELGSKMLLPVSIVAANDNLCLVELPVIQPPSDASGKVQSICLPYKNLILCSREMLMSGKPSNSALCQMQGNVPRRILDGKHSSPHLGLLCDLTKNIVVRSSVISNNSGNVCASVKPYSSTGNSPLSGCFNNTNLSHCFCAADVSSSNNSLSGQPVRNGTQQTITQISPLLSSSLDGTKSLHQSGTVTRSHQELKRDSIPSHYAKSNMIGLFDTAYDPEAPYLCGFCLLTFIDKRSACRHIRYFHYTGQFDCEYCGKRFLLNAEFDQHCATHTEHKPYYCNLCGAKFLRKQQLCNHKAVHSDVRPHLCNICNKTYKTAKQLHRHKEVHDTTERGIKRRTCRICRKVLSCSQHLVTHMRSHTGEKPHKCKVCGKGFSQHSGLHNHRLVHTGGREYSKTLCKVCGKLLYSYYFPIHMRTHTGERPFECTMCGKTFPRKQNLNGHMRCHTGEKPFQCSKCGKTFALYSNMVTHVAKCSPVVAEEKSDSK